VAKMEGVIEVDAGPAALFVLRDNPAMRDVIGMDGFVGRRAWVVDDPFSA
jgi:hypothetical protein